jgi:hypothetical protein
VVNQTPPQHPSAGTPRFCIVASKVQKLLPHFCASVRPSKPAAVATSKSCEAKAIAAALELEKRRQVFALFGRTVFVITGLSWHVNLCYHKKSAVPLLPVRGP